MTPFAAIPPLGLKLMRCNLRPSCVQFSLDDSSCTVCMGTTRVMTAVVAALEPPFPDRPSEGSVRFNVELSPMASPAFEPGRPGEDAVELARLVERGLKQSHAIDSEALCVLAGRKVGRGCHCLVRLRE